MGSSRILVCEEQRFKQPFCFFFFFFFLSFPLYGVYALSSPDTSKLQVSLCAPRTVQHDRWLPRGTLRTKLDNVMQEGLGQNISPRERDSTTTTTATATTATATATSRGGLTG